MGRPTVRALTLWLWVGLMSPCGAGAWDVACVDGAGEKCADPFARAQTPWRAHPRSEHRALLDRTLAIARLPAALRAEFALEVFALDETVTGKDEAVYPSVRPVVINAERRRERLLSIPAMANLPDMSYTLWDLAAGNELCPPNPIGDPLDCHNYETHIGWLNSNHMLPQSRRWYEHLHAIALELAADCKRQSDAVPEELRDRYQPYLLACEKQALMVEGVGHHYLQDSWSMGHLWERWGGTEIADFGGDRALGFAVGAFTGLIHGGKAMFDDLLASGAPWDDPMCAPHDNVTYVDEGVTPLEQHPAVGDVFFPALHGEAPWDIGDPFGPQRRSLYGCAVDGIRAVYAATGQVHGALEDPDTSEFDAWRSVSDDSCWAQRATNRALAEGFGVHKGSAPEAERYIPWSATADDPVEFVAAMQPLLYAVLQPVPTFAGAPVTWDPLVLAQFELSASYAAAKAIAHAIDPAHADDTNLASGGLPALAGIQPNHFYERGDAAARIPPAFYADPFPPWRLSEFEVPQAARKEVLNLFFADANAAERCRDLSPTDLEDYVAAVEEARDAGADDETLEARCGQCAQMITPHLRHGKIGAYDKSREAFCALVAPGEASFLYTEEDPASFTREEPPDYESLQRAALAACGCGRPAPEIDIKSTAFAATVVLNNSPEDILTSDGTLTFADHQTVLAVMSPTVVQGTNPGTYTGSGSASMTRAVTRTADAVIVDVTSEREVDLVITGDVYSLPYVFSAVTDQWCFELSEAAEVAFVAAPSGGLEIFDLYGSGYAVLHTETSGVVELDAVGRWCLYYHPRTEMRYVRTYASDPGYFEGEFSGESLYSLTFRSVGP